MGKNLQFRLLTSLLEGWRTNLRLLIVWFPFFNHRKASHLVTKKVFPLELGNAELVVPSRWMVVLLPRTKLGKQMLVCKLGRRGRRSNGLPNVQVLTYLPLLTRAPLWSLINYRKSLRRKENLGKILILVLTRRTLRRFFLGIVAKILFRPLLFPRKNLLGKIIRNLSFLFGMFPKLLGTIYGWEMPANPVWLRNMVLLRVTLLVQVLITPFCNRRTSSWKLPYRNGWRITCLICRTGPLWLGPRTHFRRNGTLLNKCRFS